MGLRDEILEQPVVAARLLGPGATTIDSIADAIAGRSGAGAMGHSDDRARLECG